MLVIAYLGYGLVGGAIFVHLVAYLTGIGYSLRSATIAVSVLLGVVLVGKPTMGALGDYIGGKNALAVFFAMLSVGIMLLMGAGHRWILVLFLLTLGMLGGAPNVLVPLTLSQTLGLRRFGTLFGMLSVLYTAGLLTGPIVVGWLFDLTGNYRSGFELCIVVAGVGLLASLLCTAPKSTSVKSIAGAQLPAA